MEFFVKPLILSALLGGLLLTASCGSDSSASANVVARVNGKDITTSQLDKQYQAHLNLTSTSASVALRPAADACSSRI